MCHPSAEDPGQAQDGDTADERSSSLQTQEGDADVELHAEAAEQEQEQEQELSLLSAEPLRQGSEQEEAEEEL